MSDLDNLTNKALRKFASAKAKAAGLENKNIGQRGTSSECRDYLQSDTWAVKWGEPTPIKAKAAQPSVDEQTLDLFAAVSPADTLPAADQDQHPEAATMPEVIPYQDQHPLDLPPKISSPNAHKRASQEQKPPAIAPVTPGPDTGGELTYEDFHRLTGKGRHPDIVRKEKEANAGNTGIPVNTGIQIGSAPEINVSPSRTSKKGNGRSATWFTQIHPLVDICTPAWRHLTKAATDMYIICRAKAGRAASRQVRVKGAPPSGPPTFKFPQSEAVDRFHISRPTFKKGRDLLIKLGFIKYARCGDQVMNGSIVNGQGVPSEFVLSNEWQKWKPEKKEPTQPPVNVRSKIRILGNAGIPPAGNTGIQVALN